MHGTVHKVRHFIFDQIYNPSPITLCHISEHPTKVRGERWCGRHWTPTGAEPMQQWMDGWKLVYMTLLLFDAYHFQNFRSNIAKHFSKYVAYKQPHRCFTFLRFFYLFNPTSRCSPT